MNQIKSQSGVAFTILKNQVLKVMDPYGGQVSDLFCFNYNDPAESLSAGRSIDYADSLFLTTGNDLYSNRSNKMFSIVDDTCKQHDFLMTPCSLKMFQIVAGNEEYHKSCHENLSIGFEKFNISSDAIGTTFNIFMNVKVSEHGRLKIERPLSRPGDFICLKAHQNLIVGLTACSHEETNGGICKPIEWSIS